MKLASVQINAEQRKLVSYTLPGRSSGGGEIKSQKFHYVGLERYFLFAFEALYNGGKAAERLDFIRNIKLGD